MQLLVFLMTVVTMGSGLALGTTLGLYLQYARFDHVYLYVQDIYICAIFNLTDHSRRLLSHPTLPGPHLVVLPYHGTGIHVMFKFTISHMYDGSQDHFTITITLDSLHLRIILVVFTEHGGLPPLLVVSPFLASV